MDGSSSFHHEFDAFMRTLADSERAILRAEIRDKLAAGSQGELTFGKGRQYDVDLIESARFVLEIKLANHTFLEESDDDDDPEDDLEPVERQTRIYYTEPEKEAGLLLLLSIESKLPGRIGLEEQNRHAGAAARKADEHCIYNKIL
ncbi:hypothetical protein [Pseudoclavibacter sp. 8L]|uniref:hypothetical protein n=1 Tax=Pseudoclavibacter sp. 8L TaxID=2653162 RepID=UPI0012F46CFE|nr:hypothetical protein [Pseudoclavibacter sp. 8L]VXB84525.1 conserved hypothetical protein [Pseudoclavibacter sp. 8L]